MIIAAIILLPFQAFVNACISLFLDFCMWEGNIFGGYAEWRDKKIGSFWAKPLGSCIYCMNVWIGVGTFFYCAGLIELPLQAYPLIIGYWGLSHFFLRVIYKES